MLNKNIGILDYGVGNVKSIQNMLWRINYDSKIIHSPRELSTIKKLILPGVGSYDTAINHLRERKFFQAIIDFSGFGEILGICLGMQILGDRSEEGNQEGLGIIPGNVRRFIDHELAVPHIGWNYVNFIDDEFFGSKLIRERYYFVHSYYFDPINKSNIKGITSYGVNFASVISNNQNVHGCQFHPEKSHQFGKNLLRTFCENNPSRS